MESDEPIGFRRSPSNQNIKGRITLHDPEPAFPRITLISDMPAYQYLPGAFERVPLKVYVPLFRDGCLLGIAEAFR